uniref:Uncharacterized protein n=3 Tax=Ciona intestinalis TaxID=7719 RepID=F6YGB5_CIOIN
MVVSCRFCCLQDSTTQTTNPVLVDALQQVIKSLLAKEEHDVKTFYAQNEEIEKLQKEVKELKFELQSLQNVKASLATVLSEEKQRCDEYKKKLQTAQEALVKLHSCNKKMSKNAAESLLFPRPATQSREEPYVILAPDTCQVEVSSGDNNATEIRSEPKSRDHVFTKPLAKRKCMEKQKSPHSFFKKPRNKCEDAQGHATSSRNDSDHDPDETWAPDQSDEELCIPASPILSGYSGSVKNSFFAKKFKKDTTHDGKAGDHTSDSP